MLYVLSKIDVYRIEPICPMLAQGSQGKYNIQYKKIQHNDTQHNDIQHTNKKMWHSAKNI